MALKPTNDQRNAIQATGCGILVSAAAGSGKTSVLAERCAHLICDAKEPCSVDELLVVTFTEAAAAEMRQRVESALRQRLENGGDDRLRRQLRLIEHAHISTLHSFCLQLIRQHFHRLGLDPAVRVIDDDEAALMRAETVRELFMDRYEQDDQAFLRFVDCYGSGSDARLMELVIQTHAMMNSVVEAERWMAHAIAQALEAAEKSLNESLLGKSYCELIKAELAATSRKCADALERMPREFPKYVEYVRNLAGVVEGWELALKRKGYDALMQAMGGFAPERLYGYSNSIPGKDRAAALVEGARASLKGGLLEQCALFSSADWRDGMKAVAEPVQTFLGLVGEFGQRYDKAKGAQQGMDFADLERLALKLLRDQSVASQCRDRFKYVLVDEYQDINEVQDAILSLVSTESLPDVPSNLFCVGDVKQSIYRFRLAEPQRFLDKERDFGAPSVANRGRVIYLQENFRSRRPLLDAINGVFKRLMTAEAAELDYSDAHQLRAGQKYPADSPKCFKGAPIELHLVAAKDGSASGDADEAEEYDRTEIEAMLIAQRIAHMMGRNGSSPMNVFDRKGDTWSARPIRLSDIVILLRAPKFKSAQMADILRGCGIPVQTEAGSGYFAAVEVRDMLSLLRLLDNQQQDIPLAAVLRSPLARLTQCEDALVQIRLAYDREVPFHQAAVRYSCEKKGELAGQLKFFFQQLQNWRQLSAQRPTAEVIWTIYEQTGYLAFVSGLADGAQRIANLLHLYERAKQFGSFSRQGLYRFLTFLESLQDEKETPRPNLVSAAGDAVRILSIHKSKGLEFPVVFVADLGKAHNLADCKGSILVDRRQYVGMDVIDDQRQIRYPSLAKVMIQQQVRKQLLAEELRLLYVAMTRAKEHLVLVGTCTDKKAEQWQSWRGHAGPMPAEDVLGAPNMLDWIGPAAHMEDKFFQINRHDEQETSQWSAEEIRRPKFTEQQQKLARLEPISPAPAVDAHAQKVIDALSFRYPHQALTQAAAARSVTQWTKQQLPAPSMESEEDPRATPGSLTEPRCVAEVLKPTAIDIGNTTHLVLQYLDFNSEPDEMAVARQINEMVSRRLISARQARSVDIDGILWVLAGEIGDLVRTHKKVRSELAFYIAAPAEAFEQQASSQDTLDQVMVRGRIDVVIETPAGLIVVDYKTDRLTADQVDARTAFYSGQMQAYRKALEQIAKKKVIKTCLAFLSPKVMRSL